MITQRMVDAFNGQINKEIFSAYLYASMEAHFIHMGLDGFANWMKVQTNEELHHARKMMDFVVDRGGKVIFSAIDTPENDWKNIREVYEKSLEHEKFISSEIDNLVTIAEEEKDRASAIFLQWYVTEQVEEEHSIETIIDKLKLTECTGDAVFHLDTEFSGRSSD